MTSDRDRLIDLLKETFDYTRGVCMDFDEAVEINADYLLANGVILPLKNSDIISCLKAELENSCLSQLQIEPDFFKIENGKIVFSTNGASDYRREFESLDEVVEELNHAARQILSDTTALCFYRKAMENRCEKISSIPEHEEKSAMGLLII